MLVFVYIGLLFFEGALRKWFFPELSVPLLVVRDPIAIAIIWAGFWWQLWPPSGYRTFIVIMALVMGASGVLQLLLDSRLNWPVVVFGWRTYILHLPVIFVAARTLTAKDLEVIGRWCCRIAPPMIVLCYLQYYAGADSLWNTGAGKDAAQIAFEGEKVRASGTFSFATGTACFFALVAAFAWAQIALPYQSRRDRIISFVALFACIAFMPVSGGRLGMFMVGIVVACGAVMILRSKYFVYIAVALLGLYGLSKVSFFNDAVESMSARLESARIFENEQSDWGFWARVAGGFRTPLDAIGEVPLFIGFGLGLGTQAGAALAGSAGDFLLGEGEWDRILGECGWTLGMLYIAFRVWITMDLFRRAIRAILQQSYWLPLLLWSGGAWTMLQGQVGQPTNLGFFVVNVAVVMIALKGNPLIVTPEWFTWNRLRVSRLRDRRAFGRSSPPTALGNPPTRL